MVPLRVMLCTALAVLALSWAAFAQYGGTSIPNPFGHKRGSKKPDRGGAVQTLSAQGSVVSRDASKLVIATEDGRFLTMAVTPQTTFTRSAGTIPADKVVLRSVVGIEADEDSEANLTVTHVNLVKDPPPDEPGPAPVGSRPDNTDAPPTPAVGQAAPLETPDNSPNAPGRPVLRRGRPSATSGNNETADTATMTAPRVKEAPTPAKGNSGDFTIDAQSAAAPAPSHGNDELVGRTQQWASTFTEGLPNFVCQQFTTRYVEFSRSSGWQPQDVIGATVVYEDGKENYRDITVGGHKVSKSMMDVGGSTSTGEFASTLRSLFAPQSRADFKLYQRASGALSSSTIYDFKVPLKSSDWSIKIGGQLLRPAYSGSVWIDRSNAQVRRIEMQADKIPADFPLDSVEWSVDYDQVRLGGSSAFLLPVHAENLGCQRGSNTCTKNAIDFRNYHKYSGESTITFDK